MRWACLILLALFLLAGCSSGPDTLHGEMAVYQFDDGSVWVMQLFGPVEGLDRDGTTLMAYRVEVSLPEGKPVATLLLDHDFRLLRADTPCAVFDGRCVEGSATWEARGALPAWGIGLPYQAVLLEGLQEVDGTYSFDGRSAPHTGSLGPGSYRFDGRSRTFPAEFRITEGNVHSTRTRLETTGELSPAAKLNDLRAPAGAVPFVDRPWAGGTSGLNGQKESASQLLQILVENVPLAREWLETGGCVSRMLVEPAVSASPGLLDSGSSAVAEISVSSTDGRSGEWLVTRSSDILGNDSYQVEIFGPGIKADCEALRRLSPMGLSIDSFAEQAARMPLLHGENSLLIMQIQSQMLPDEDCPVRYAQQWEPTDTPANAPFTPYEVVAEACGALLVKLRAAPQSVEAFRFGFEPGH